MDPSSSQQLDIPKKETDFGQTLGVYGVGQGFYLVWPVLGPSSARDSIGMVGDYFLDPVSYISPWPETLCRSLCLLFGSHGILVPNRPRSDF